MVCTVSVRMIAHNAFTLVTCSSYCQFGEEHEIVRTTVDHYEQQLLCAW